MKKLIVILSVCLLLTSTGAAFDDTALMRVVAIHPRCDGCSINYELILWNEDGYASVVTGEWKDLRLGDLVEVKLEPGTVEKGMPHATRATIIRKVKN